MLPLSVHPFYTENFIRTFYLLQPPCVNPMGPGSFVMDGLADVEPLLPFEVPQPHQRALGRVEAFRSKKRFFMFLQQQAGGSSPPAPLRLSLSLFKSFCGVIGELFSKSSPIVLSDPLTAQPHDPDVKALLRIAQVYDIPIANSRATADFIITSPYMDSEYAHTLLDFKSVVNERAKKL